MYDQLGVFSGGADLDAISAVTIDVDVDNQEVILDPVSDLVDASLLIVTETPNGEPRIGMLETVRSYAYEQLITRGELPDVRARHANYYPSIAEKWSPLLISDRYGEARNWFDLEYENLHGALNWALQPPEVTDASTERIGLGLRLCSALNIYWERCGYFSEGRSWLERAIERGGSRDGPELALCLERLAVHMFMLDDLEDAREYATACVSMWRRLGERGIGLAKALNTLAVIEMLRGEPLAARLLSEENVSVARASNDKHQLQLALGNFAILESNEQNYWMSLQLDGESLAVSREIGDPVAELGTRHNIASALRQMGRVREAEEQLRALTPEAVLLKDQTSLLGIADDYATILVALGHHLRAVQLLGAADATRERLGIPHNAMERPGMNAILAQSQTAVNHQNWNAAYEAGRSTTVEDALTDATTAVTTATTSAGC